MKFSNELINQIKHGAVGILPTDTIFGIVARAADQKAVERIYQIKQRDYDKPFVVLVAHKTQLSELSIQLGPEIEQTLEELWANPVSVILLCQNPKLAYLHRGKFSLAVRRPNSGSLLDLIAKTGPIVATSANKSGQETPSTIADIKHQLPGLDFYIDGHVGTIPSRLASLHNDGQVEWLERIQK